eukprot:TRINITY_DN6741_c0_g1_i2.p1 TRINITY_DN6741_c0_g1~~TRINITY_DN6741_c0_g1_i2.p1  ORF type:complete len:225 (-),score=-16.67 TRINITY_DN6741_c0_g1_i2:92-766(-)
MIYGAKNPPKNHHIKVPQYPRLLNQQLHQYLLTQYIRKVYIHKHIIPTQWISNINHITLTTKNPIIRKTKNKNLKRKRKKHQIMEMTISRFTQGCNIDFLFTCNYLISLANLIEIRTYKYKTTQGKLNLKEANNLQYIYIYIFFVALVRIYKYEYIRDKTNRVQNQFKKGQQSTIYIYIQILLQFSQEPTNTIYKQQNQPCEKNNQKKVSTIHKYILLQLCSVI